MVVDKYLQIMTDICDLMVVPKMSILLSEHYIYIPMHNDYFLMLLQPTPK